MILKKIQNTKKAKNAKKSTIPYNKHRYICLLCGEIKDYADKLTFLNANKIFSYNHQHGNYYGDFLENYQFPRGGLFIKILNIETF